MTSRALKPMAYLNAGTHRHDKDGIRTASTNRNSLRGRGSPVPMDVCESISRKTAMIRSECQKMNEELSKLMEDSRPLSARAKVVARSTPRGSPKPFAATGTTRTERMARPQTIEEPARDLSPIAGNSGEIRSSVDIALVREMQLLRKTNEELMAKITSRGVTDSIGASSSGGKSLEVFEPKPKLDPLGLNDDDGRLVLSSPKDVLRDVSAGICRQVTEITSPALSTVHEADVSLEAASFESPPCLSPARRRPGRDSPELPTAEPPRSFTPLPTVVTSPLSVKGTSHQARSPNMTVTAQRFEPLNFNRPRSAHIHSRRQTPFGTGPHTPELRYLRDFVRRIAVQSPETVMPLYTARQSSIKAASLYKLLARHGWPFGEEDTCELIMASYGSVKIPVSFFDLNQSPRHQSVGSYGGG